MSVQILLLLPVVWAVIIPEPHKDNGTIHFLWILLMLSWFVSAYRKLDPQLNPLFHSATSLILIESVFYWLTDKYMGDLIGFPQLSWLRLVAYLVIVYKLWAVWNGVTPESGTTKIIRLLALFFIPVVVWWVQPQLQRIDLDRHR